MILGVDIWSCLWLVGILFRVFYCSLVILGKWWAVVLGMLLQVGGWQRGGVPVNRLLLG